MTEENQDENGGIQPKVQMNLSEKEDHKYLILRNGEEWAGPGHTFQWFKKQLKPELTFEELLFYLTESLKKFKLLPKPESKVTPCQLLNFLLEKMKDFGQMNLNKKDDSCFVELVRGKPKSDRKDADKEGALADDELVGSMYAFKSESGYMCVKSFIFLRELNHCQSDELGWTMSDFYTSLVEGNMLKNEPLYLSLSEVQRDLNSFMQNACEQPPTVTFKSIGTNMVYSLPTENVKSKCVFDFSMITLTRYGVQFKSDHHFFHVALINRWSQSELILPQRDKDFKRHLMQFVRAFQSNCVSIRAKEPSFRDYIDLTKEKVVEVLERFKFTKIEGGDTLSFQRTVGPKILVATLSEPETEIKIAVHEALDPNNKQLDKAETALHKELVLPNSNPYDQMEQVCLFLREVVGETDSCSEIKAVN